MKAPLDFGSIAVMVITLILFIFALFVHGFTRDLFLEAAIFLVSAKMIIMAYRNGVAANRVEQKLDTIIAAMEKSGIQKECLSSKKCTSETLEKSEKSESGKAE